MESTGHTQLKGEVIRVALKSSVAIGTQVNGQRADWSPQLGCFACSSYFDTRAFQVVRFCLPMQKMQEMWVRILDWDPLQYSCPENAMDRGAWWTTVHGVAQESDTTKHTRTHSDTHPGDLTQTEKMHLLWLGAPRFPGFDSYPKTLFSNKAFQDRETESSLSYWKHCNI